MSSWMYFFFNQCIHSLGLQFTSKCHYMSWFTVKYRDMVTSDFLARQTDEQSLTPSIMSAVLEIAGVEPSCTEHGIVVFTWRSCSGGKGRVTVMSESSSACWWRVYQGRVCMVESLFLSQYLPRSRPLWPSLSPECNGEAGGGIHFPLQAPVTLSFQQNSSLPKRAGIHSLIQ